METVFIGCCDQRAIVEDRILSLAKSMYLHSLTTVVVRTVLP